jgi:hypothetical protein
METPKAYSHADAFVVRVSRQCLQDMYDRDEYIFKDGNHTACMHFTTSGVKQRLPSVSPAFPLAIIKSAIPVRVLAPKLPPNSEYAGA